MTQVTPKPVIQLQDQRFSGQNAPNGPARSCDRRAERLRRWGLIPYYADVRPDLQPILVRAETISGKRTFAEAYRKRALHRAHDRFILKDASKKRHAISRMDVRHSASPAPNVPMALFIKPR